MSSLIREALATLSFMMSNCQGFATFLTASGRSFSGWRMTNIRREQVEVCKYY